MNEPARDEDIARLPAAHLSQATSAESPDGARMPYYRVRLLIILGALLAGLVSFGIGELIYKIIPAEKVLQSVMMTNAKVMLPTQATEDVATARNGALAFGLLGLCLAGALGIAGGLARRSTLAAIRGGLLGTVLGVALGVGLSLGLLPLCLSQQNRYSDDDLIVLIVSLVTHGLIWGLLGASAGLAFTVGLEKPQQWHRALLAGLGGAVVGTVVFELAGGI